MNKQQAELAKLQFKSGLITYEEARKLIKPFIDEFNKKTVEIAKKYNQRPRKITAAAYLR